MGSFIGHFGCINKECGSSDALGIYVDSDDSGNEYLMGKCFSCKQVFSHNKLADSYLGEILSIEKIDVGNHKHRSFNYTIKEKKPIEQQEVDNIREISEYDSTGFRKIATKVNERFKVLTEYDEKSKPIKRYYPIEEDGVLVGYKVRVIETKDFFSIGKSGANVDVFGKNSVKNAKTCIITAGEEDCMSAYQILVQFFHSKGYNQNIHVVSPVVGETSAVKHIQHNYPFFDQFEKIIVCFDNDEAGVKGAADVAEVLPAGKTYVMSFMEKDVNDCLVHNNPKEFIDAYYAAKKYMPEGIKSSDTCMEAVFNELNTPRLTLPAYMNQMQANMGGGILDATITNVIADTSVGKSSHVNNMVYHWVFNAPTPPTIISLEATQGQWTVDLLSLHLKTNLRWMEEKERTAFLSDPLTIEKCNQFFYKEDGSSRFYIIDDREGDIKKLEKLMERAYKQFGSNIIIFDVLTDALRGMDSDLQESHMKFQKMFIKNGIRLINVLHTRKPPKSKDGKPVPISEYDALGSSTFVQSGAYNILLERDKEAEDAVEKNTTYVRMPKCRGGITGACGEWYFDFKTRQCYDKKDYFTSKDQVVTTEDGFEVTI